MLVPIPRGRSRVSIGVGVQTEGGWGGGKFRPGESLNGSDMRLEGFSLSFSIIHEVTSNLG